jgi:two-component system response regulator YesN
MSYQLLLVDDEIHAIEGVKADLELEKLGITRLFTAYSMSEAQEVFAKEVVDILLCDIEMPQGSGLELLAWVRERHPNTATIFLTSHADFKYAKEALKMGSIDYLLKPVLTGDLENAIRKAQDEIDRNSEIDRSIHSHQLWLKHHAYIVERFWLDLINHVTPSRPDTIKEQAERHHIPLSDEYVFLPILIVVRRWNKSINRRDEMIMEYALRNSAEEIIIDSYPNSVSIQMERGTLLLILGMKRESIANQGKIAEACERYVSSCNQYFYCDLCCYIGKEVPAYEVSGMVGGLRLQDRNNVSEVNRVFRYRSAQPTATPAFNVPALGAVSSLLRTGTTDSVIKEVSTILNNLAGKRQMDADALLRVHQDFIQVLYSFLNERGVQAHRLFADTVSVRLSEKASRSIADMMDWVRHAVEKAVKQAHAADETETVVEAVKLYISFHLEEDLSREQLAEQVFLNPDYMARIFKKETGQTILDYITFERVKLAKELLSNSNNQIGSIASAVGYTNFSHFAKVFKKYEGIGPMEYRTKLLNK